MKQVKNTHICVCMCFSLLFWKLGYFILCKIYFSLFCHLFSFTHCQCSMFMLSAEKMVCGITSSGIGHLELGLSMRLCWKKYCAQKRVLFFIWIYWGFSVSHPDWIGWIVLAKRGKNTWHFVMLDSNDPIINHCSVSGRVCREVQVLSAQRGCSGPFISYCVLTQQLGNLPAGGDTGFEASLSWCKWVCKAGWESHDPLPWLCK